LAPNERLIALKQSQDLREDGAVLIAAPAISREQGPDRLRQRLSLGGLEELTELRECTINPLQVDHGHS
jgi:hypothetical protein